MAISKSYMRSKTLSNLESLFNYLPRRRYRDLFFVMAVSVLQGLMDIFLVALIARLVGLMAGTKLADQLPGIKIFGGDLFDQAGWLVVILIVAFWLTALTRFLAALLQSMLSAEIWGDLIHKAYENIIFQNYEYFLSRQSSDLSATFNRILGKISNAVIAPLLSVVGNLLSVIVLFIGVTFVLGGSSLIMFILMIGAYILSSNLISPYIKFATKQQVRYSEKINSLLMESLGSIRDVHIYSAHQHFIDKFSSDGVVSKKYDRLIKLMPDVPRYVIEPAGVTILFLIGLTPAVVSGETEKVKEAMPILAAILGTLLRVSGPLTNTFRDLSKIRGGTPEISNILQILSLTPEKKYLCSLNPKISSEGISPRYSVKLEDVCFAYDKSGGQILDNVNLTIPVGSRVALVGSTGSGKTTIAHILLGLFSPSSGKLLLDGVELSDDEISAWQDNCALVPQDIRLMNSSIKENVAFGCNPDEINDDEIWLALKSSKLATYVSKLPYGMYTMVGEDGVNLSGGQRQRLALARAFFRRASFLVLDEATSALDNSTERDLMQTLDVVGRHCTTVIIAHRLSTIKKCDCIYEIENGKIKAFGSYEMLQSSSSSFCKLTQLEKN